MEISTQKRFALTGNQLKLLAMALMTVDHIGLQLLPQYPVLRIIGRLALPIYAYMIAEGCRYTRSRLRYGLGIAAMALVCQIVTWVAMGSVYQCILVTFGLSIGLCCLADRARQRPCFLSWALMALGLVTAWFLSMTLPRLLPGTDFRIDYDFFGILLPVLIFLGKDRRQALVLCAVGLVALSLSLGGNQWFCLLALPILALYGGSRGRANLKYLFYLYYPGHLVVIYLLTML